jgi:hypothetical protein
MSNPLYHLGMSAVIAGGSYLATQSPTITISTFVIGTFIDLDHFIDYAFGNGEKKGLKFLDPHFYEKQSKLFMFFHAYEWALLLCILGMLFHFEVLAFWLALSYVIHIGSDQIAYKPHQLFYYIAYRIKRRFSSEIQGKEYPPQSLSVKLIVIIGVIYLLLYGTAFSTYHLPAVKTEIGTYLALCQWAIPSLLLIFFILVPIVNKFKFVFNVSFVTHIGITILIICIILQIMNVSGAWWSWSTMGLIAIIVLTVLTFNKDRMNDTDVILFSMLPVFIGFGIFEAIYQVGVLKFYDFFGCDHRNFWIVMMELMFWIFPSIIAVVYLNHKYKRAIYPNYYVLISFVLAIIATAIWFANGFAIPVIWIGTKPYLTNDNSLLIAISRYSQVFITIGIALLFVPIKGFRHVKTS